MVRFAVALIAGIFLAGCEAKVEVPYPHLKVGTSHYHEGGGFCPPGQAKKGNC